jgi:hypothetical protein
VRARACVDEWCTRTRHAQQHSAAAGAAIIDGGGGTAAAAAAAMQPSRQPQQQQQQGLGLPALTERQRAQQFQRALTEMCAQQRDLKQIYRYVRTGWLAGWLAGRLTVGYVCAARSID